MAFPYTPRYFIRFRHSDTGLTPSFSYFKRADTMVGVTAPTIYEVGGGTYYFDYTFDTQTDPDIVFEVDGGASIPTEEVRYVSDTLSPRDGFLDQPTSQVSGDVWSYPIETTDADTMGWRLDKVGTPDDGLLLGTIFGRMLRDTVEIKGDYTLFEGIPPNGGNSVKQVYDRVGAPATTTLSADLQADTVTLQNEVTSAVSSIKGLSSKDLTQVDAHLDTTESDLMTAIEAVGTATGSIPSDLATRLTYLQESTKRLLGLTKENSLLTNTFFDSQGNLIQADLVLYPTDADALAGTSAFATYRVTASWDGQKVQTYKMVKQP